MTGQEADNGEGSGASRRVAYADQETPLARMEDGPRGSWTRVTLVTAIVCMPEAGIIGFKLVSSKGETP